MNQSYTYFLILLISFAGPFILSFDKKVSFFKKWDFAIPAMILPAIFYIGWDMWFTNLGIWSFNEKYITGILIYNLPVEEILFFFIVPYCCIFIYECIRTYFPDLKCTKEADYILGAISLILIIVGIFFREKLYTATTFVFTAFFIGLILSLRNYFKTFHTTAFLISYGIILIPFLVINGFLTALPVVLYNDAENLGLRIYTIPAEDVFYGMLLVLMNVTIYEKLKMRSEQYDTQF